MSPLIQNWFRIVDISPSVINSMGYDFWGESWARRCWKTAYRDARMRARIACHSLDEMVAFRGFGILKDMWSKRRCVIGRTRVNDLKTFTDDAESNGFFQTDYNRYRILK